MAKAKLKPAIDLGTAQDAMNMFSHPPNHNALFLLTERGKKLSSSLENTIELYVNTSLERDGFSDARATAQVTKGRVSLTITGATTGAAATQSYAAALSDLFTAGKIGLSITEENAKQVGDPIPRNALWRYNWRFFLPLGIPMVNHKSVQLLHFPPDSVLSRDQDYLAASTTQRWAKLLVVNGADPAKTDLYQNIIDIAPIAAPHADGNNLGIDVCITYTKYIEHLLDRWLPKADGSSRPMVAFGTPVRQWLQRMFVPDQQLGVLSLLELKLKSGLRVSTLTANHPSMIFNLDDDLKDDPNIPGDERLCRIIPAMQEDLIAANWQVRMSESPSSDPKAVLDECKAKWSNPDRTEEVCRLIYEQVFNMTPQKAAEMVQNGLPACAQSVATEPVGVLAMKYKADMVRVCTKLGGLDAMMPGSLDA